MDHPALFDVGTIIRNPFCLYEPHCGGRAELGPVVDMGGGCENREVRCLRCPTRGVLSRNRQENKTR